MLSRILIAEDHESSNISIRRALEDFGKKNNDYVYYCDDAMARLRHGITHHQPYSLLITDLSFEDDGTPQNLTSGVQLIKAAKELQPDLKVIVFSAESKSAIIDQLFKELGIDAFVRKARHDVAELKQALEAINSRKRYLSVGLRKTIKENNSHEFTPYDIALITLLSKGVFQKQIPDHLRRQEIKPSGLSSVEKRLNHIRETLNFSKNEQLVAFCKDIGVI